MGGMMKHSVSKQDSIRHNQFTMRFSERLYNQTDSELWEPLRVQLRRGINGKIHRQIYKTIYEALCK